MSSTAATPLATTLDSNFFSGHGGDESYRVSDERPVPEAASLSSSTGVSNSVVIMIIVLSITVIVSISLCFLIRVLSGRCTRRLRADEESGGNGSATRVRASRRVQPVGDEQDQSQNPNSTPEVNNGLRMFDFESVKDGGGDCPICLSKFEPADNLRLLPICCHAFHAECVDVWLESNQSCPLCRSAIFASEAEILRKIQTAPSAQSLRLELSSMTVRQQRPDPAPAPARILINQPTQVSVHPGSLIRTESETKLDQPNHPLAAEIEHNRNWLRDYMETLSSRTASFRSSTRSFTGSSRRTETLPGDRYWDIEASRAGEEISEMFRWFSGI